PLAIDEIERRERRGAAHRVPAEGRTVCPWRPRHHRLARDDRADGHSGREPLRCEQDVRLDALVLAGEHLPRPAYSTLHLVGDEQDPMPVAQLTESGQKAYRRHDVPALPL